MEHPATPGARRVVTRRLNIGVIGLRFGADVHVPAFRNDPRCEVRALAGRDLAKVTDLTRRLGVPCPFDDWRALVDSADEWSDGEFNEYRGGSGRELCWFPNPVGPRDCYRADLAEPLLLVRAFPNASRISARVAATRRDRVLGRLPMLRAPHLEGADGAVRVEIRGTSGQSRVTVIGGAASPPAIAAGAVAASVALFAWRKGAVGAMACSEITTPDVLADVMARGVRVSQFIGRPV